MNCFDARDVSGLVEGFRRMYATVSHADYHTAERKNLGESFYRAVLLSFLHGAGFETRSEEHNNFGRMDILAEREGRQMVIEMKIAADAGEAAAKAKEGMEQITERAYGNRFQNPLLLSLGVSREDRNIGAWLSGERGAARKWENSGRPVS